MKRLKLLVAIRSTMDSDLISGFLNSGDFRLLFAMSGEEALDTLRYNPGFDLVLADVSLPCPGGVAISSAIRSVNAYVPLIGMTAYPVDKVLKQKVGMGVDGWLMKPFSREELEKAVWMGMTRIVSV